MQEEPRANGWRVHDRKRTDGGNAGDFRGEIVRARRGRSPRRLMVVQSGECGVLEIVKHAAAGADGARNAVGDHRVLCNRETFGEWAAGRKTWCASTAVAPCAAGSAC